MDINQESVEQHKQNHGVIQTASKVPINDRHDLSLAYTPGVAQVSLEIDKDKSLVREYTLKHNTVAVISDGSSILGLGNLGPEAAIPVMEGKAVLFKEFAGIDAFPICLDTQDTEEIIKTIKHIAPVFGGINLEDISAPRCFEIERRLQKELNIPVMHDDQHGTAVVVTAGMINALKLKNMSKEQVKVVINGAGSAGIAITKLLIQFGVKEIIMCDSKGAIFSGRADLNDEKIKIAQETNHNKIQGDLAAVLKGSDIFIGVSKGNTLTEEMVRSMAKDPVIFALANPIPEIMPEQALKAGAFAIATGRSDFPNQINNVLAFPGIFRGALDNKIKQFTDKMFLDAAHALAACVSAPHPDALLPLVFDKEVVKAVASAIK